MPKDRFDFKQFSIKQDACAMKVSTDACVFGAWVAEAVPARANRVADIGAGTGLLTLMLAQAWPEAHFEAIEIDAAAAEQAVQNAAASLWASRITVHAQAVQQFALQKQATFDVVVSNPPFFVNALKAPDKQRNIARHTDQLPYADLLTAAEHMLQPNGYLLLLLPVAEADLLWSMLLPDWSCTRQCTLSSKVGKPPHRVFLMLQKSKTVQNQQEEAWVLHNPDGTYTDRVRTALAPYYLYL
jgi:tRNA1Val (adenine37-N6)-methyltransferase